MAQESVLGLTVSSKGGVLALNKHAGTTAVIPGSKAGNLTYAIKHLSGYIRHQTNYERRKWVCFKGLFATCPRKEEIGSTRSLFLK